jgi:pimeloyl-ACP methyl ester carboxylesterase
MIGEFRIGVGSPPAFSSAELGQLTAPTCLLMGQHEITFAPGPYRVLERAVNLLPNLISAEIVPGVGHMMTHERLDRVIPRVLSFLENHAA